MFGFGSKIVEKAVTAGIPLTYKVLCVGGAALGAIGTAIGSTAFVRTWFMARRGDEYERLAASSGRQTQQLREQGTRLANIEAILMGRATAATTAASPPAAPAAAPAQLRTPRGRKTGEAVTEVTTQELLAGTDAGV